MSLGRNKEHIEKVSERANIDIGTGHRYRDLMRKKKGFEKGSVIKDIQLKLSRTSEEDSINEIIKSLVTNIAYGKYKLSLDEFVAFFKEGKFSNKLVDDFINGLNKVDADENLHLGADWREEKVMTDLRQSDKKDRAACLDVAKFLEKTKLRSAETLFMRMQTVKQLFRGVNVRKLFDVEFEDMHGKLTTLRKEVAKTIDEMLETVAANTYAVKFEEDKKGFVLGFMMRRVMWFGSDVPNQTPKMDFDIRQFKNLMSYLDSLGYQVDNIDGQTLYQWLYHESREMASYDKKLKINNLREGVRSDIAETSLLRDVFKEGRYKKVGDGSKPDIGFFSDNFNVQEFYKTNIFPQIARFKDRKIFARRNIARANGVDDRVREVELLQRADSANSLLQTVYSSYHGHYLQVLVDTYKEDKAAYYKKLREIFGLKFLIKRQSDQGVELLNEEQRALIRAKVEEVLSSGGGADEVSKIIMDSMLQQNTKPKSKPKVVVKEMTEEQIEKHLAYLLEVAAGKFSRNLSDAIIFRNKDNNLKKDLKYFPEILECRNLGQLFVWLNSTEQFKKDFPKYKDVPEEIIWHQCLILVKEFTMVSKRVSSDDFVQVEGKRDGLEEKFIVDLSLDDLGVLQVNFKFLKEINGKGRFTVVSDNPEVSEYMKCPIPEEDVKMVMETSSLESVGFENVKYKVSALEQASFRMVRMTLHYMEEAMDEKSQKTIWKEVKKEIEVLIYSGDGHLIHVKDLEARLLSETRGKEVSDENRWLIVFKNNQDLEAYKNYTYANQPMEFLKVDDPAAGIHLSTKGGKSARTKSSKGFKEEQQFAAAWRYGVYEDVDEDGRGLRHNSILEHQSQGLEKLLKSNLSIFSPTSHKLYRAQRAWELLYWYFNPQIWGDKYQEYLDQGPTFGS